MPDSADLGESIHRDDTNIGKEEEHKHNVNNVTKYFII